nr:MAG TPA: hypothetical protein [Caudoviricetes sp.]
MPAQYAPMNNCYPVCLFFADFYLLRDFDIFN